MVLFYIMSLDFLTNSPAGLQHKQAALTRSSMASQLPVQYIRITIHATSGRGGASKQKIAATLSHQRSSPNVSNVTYHNLT